MRRLYHSVDLAFFSPLSGHDEARSFLGTTVFLSFDF